MTKQRVIASWFGLFFLFATTAPALADDTSATQASPFSLLNFSGAYVSYSQNVGSTQSFELTWNPRYALSQRFALIGWLGGAPLKRVDGSKFFALDAQILAEAKLILGFSAQAGGGLQDWISNGGVFFAWSLNLGYDFDMPAIGIPTRIFVGYGSVASPNSTSVYEAGLSLRF